MFALCSAVCCCSPAPTTAVVINVLYNSGHTGHGHNASLGTPAVSIHMDGFGMGGLLAAEVRPSARHFPHVQRVCVPASTLLGFVLHSLTVQLR